MNLNKIIPHIVALLVAFFLMAAYFKPIILDGKTLRQGDVQQAQAMQAEIMAEYKKTGHYPKWTNQMFMGMPSYLIYGAQQNNLVEKVTNNIVFFGNKYNVTDPHVLFFWLMIFAYVGLLLFDIPAWIALGAAVSFGFMTNNSVLLEAGHCNKVFTMLYTLPVLGAAWQCLKGRWLWGGALFAFFCALQLSAGHVQITYYTFFIVGFMALAKIIFDRNNWQEAGKSIAALALATVLGVGANLTTLWTTYEYSQESIRGRSELQSKPVKNGLEKDYIYSYCFDKKETFTLFVPHFYGGSSDESWVSNKNSHTSKFFSTIPPDLGNQLSSLTRRYWGSQLSTSGPIYWGAALFFMAILGLLVAPKTARIGLGAVLGLFMMLSWGKHFTIFNDLMVDFFPFYNKFRDVKMTLYVGQAAAVALAALAAKYVWELSLLTTEIKEKALNNFEKQLKIAAGLVLGAIAIVLLYSFVGELENITVAEIINEQRAQNPQIVPVLENMEAAMQKDRADLMRADALKSFLIVALAVAMLWAFARQKVGAALALGLIAGASLLDLWLVDKMYLVDDKNVQKSSFKPRKDIFGRPNASQADLQIQQDKDLHFRVLDLEDGTNPMSNAQRAYFHHLVGGYHAAKPILFQEVIEKYGMSLQTIDKYPQIFEMMNAKYVIANMPNQKEPVAMPLQTVLGNAWFVANITWVENADQERDSLATFFPNNTALVQKKFEPYMQGFVNSNGANDKIYLTAYAPEKLTYKSISQGERLAVFSEIYYPPAKGWNVYIDGQLIPAAFIKVNYLLRGLRVPAGEHTIEFRFEPRAVSTGETVALLSSLSIWILLGAAGFLLYKQSKLGA